MSNRVLIYGEDHPGSLSRSYRRGFEDHGATVTNYCPARALEQVLPAMRYRVARRLLHAVGSQRLNERVVQDLSTGSPDLILVLKGAHLSGETILRLKAATGAVVVNYYPDDPFSEIRSNRLLHGPATLAKYDLCFTFARHLMPQYHRVGVRSVEYLPFARDPDLHSPVVDVGAPDFDVVFAGNLDEERVRWLEGVADFKLVVYGEHTRQALHRRSPLRSATFLPGVYGTDFARAIRRGAIALNLMRLQNAGSHNMRSFESPACQAFTMSQRTPELTTLFREDEEIVCFGSPDELRLKVREWLSRDAGDREAVAAAGFRRVENDTYAVRADTIRQAVAQLPRTAKPST